MAIISDQVMRAILPCRALVLPLAEYDEYVGLNRKTTTRRPTFGKLLERPPH